LTFEEGYIAVLASPSQFLVLLCLWPLLQVQMEAFIGAGGDVHCEGLGVPARNVTP